jgi:CubicO group peptidase (beta-lactamase class C family)
MFSHVYHCWPKLVGEGRLRLDDPLNRFALGVMNSERA